MRRYNPPIMATIGEALNQALGHHRAGRLAEAL
jgi:hypothetical protein